MSRVCYITGKKTMFGNNVSHSNRKTKRRFLVNLHKYKFWNEEKKSFVHILLSVKGLRIVNKFGISCAIKKFIKNKV